MWALFPQSKSKWKEREYAYMLRRLEHFLSVSEGKSLGRQNLMESETLVLEEWQG